MVRVTTASGFLSGEKTLVFDAKDYSLNGDGDLNIEDAQGDIIAFLYVSLQVPDAVIAK